MELDQAVDLHEGTTGHSGTGHHLREMLVDELVGVAPPTRFGLDQEIKLFDFGYGTYLK